MAAAALVTALTLQPVPGRAGSRYTQRSRKLGPGLKFVKIVDSQGPKRIFLLRVNPARAVSVDTVMAGSTFPAWAKTTAMAARSGALAAVNGDFVKSGRPVHPYAQDGELLQSGLQRGANLAVATDGSASYTAASTPTVVAHRVTGGESFTVDRWNNGKAASGQVAGFTDAFSSVERPPKESCSARLLPLGSPQWASGRRGVARDYRVDRVSCQRLAMSLGGGIVLATRQAQASSRPIRSLLEGERVRLTWSLGWPAILDSIGGSPRLLDNGRVVAPASCASYFCGRNPRTAVGVTANGTVLIMVVDGRRPGYSIGMRLDELANELKRNGAVDAVNLDGGGAATMVVKDRIVNRPTDSSERSVSNALVVIRGSDPDEPGSLSYAPRTGSGAPAPATREEARASERAALLDPGSTGGLLEALASGGLSPGATPGDRRLSTQAAVGHTPHMPIPTGSHRRLPGEGEVR